MRNLEEDYNPFRAPQLDDPYPIWAQARDQRPVFHSAVLDAWVVTRFHDVVSMLRNPTVFGPVAQRKMFAAPCPEADRILADLPPLEETNALASEPPVHTKLRRYLQPAFTPRRVAHLEPALRQTAHRLIDRFETRGHGDFYTDYAYRYPLSVVCRLIGLPEEHQEQVKKWAGQRIELRYANLSQDEQIVAAHAQQDYYDFTLELIARRRAEPGEDLLSWIIQDSDSSEDPLTEAQLASQATSLLTAGHETTAHWLTLAVHRTLQEPGRWAALTANREIAVAQIEESLRMDGPVQAIWRRAKTSTEIDGVRVPGRRPGLGRAWLGQLRRSRVRRAGDVRRRPAERRPAPGLRPGHPYLRRCGHRAAGGPDLARDPRRSPAEAPARPRSRVHDQA